MMSRDTVNCQMAYTAVGGAEGGRDLGQRSNGLMQSLHPPEDAEPESNPATGC